MTATAHAIALTGIEGIPIRVEAQLGSGLVSTTIVGLADTALRESKERLRSALSSCQIPAQNRRLTINLSPASLPKNGSSFDLPIAVAVLTARGLVSPTIGKDTVFAAELGLDGSVRPVMGVLAQAWAARRHGFKRIVVAAESLPEASEVSGIEVVGCEHLHQLLEAFPTGLEGRGWQSVALSVGGGRPLTVRDASHPGREPDMVEVRGQPQARQAALMAAVGGHHLLLHGDAGSGKTMIAERLGSILPAMDKEDALILAAMRSSLGEPHYAEFTRVPPVQIVSPTVTPAGLVGGGARQVRPGLVSLAHGGVLVLNEAPDFAPRVLDSLRGPLDTGEVTIRRSTGTVAFPAQFQLVLTANECPCGNQGDETGCRCTPMQRRRYQQRISGPLIDRVDIQMRVEQPTLAQIEDDTPLRSKQAREMVTEARARSSARWERYGFRLNSQIPGQILREHQGLPDGFRALLDRSVSQGQLSLRGADRILRVAWSAADLLCHPIPTAEDLSYALQLRTEAVWGQG